MSFQSVNSVCQDKKFSWMEWISLTLIKKEPYKEGDEATSSQSIAIFLLNYSDRPIILVLFCSHESIKDLAHFF